MALKSLKVLFNTYINYIQTYSASIQAISTIVLIYITYKYVKITHELVHAPFKAYVKPKALNPNKNEKGWEIIVHNYGPALARDVLVKVWTRKYLKTDPTDLSKVIINYKLIKAVGELEIAANCDESYTFEGIIDWDNIIFIQWVTITGKKQRSAWIINTESCNDKILPLNRWRYLKFKSRLLWDTFLTLWKIFRSNKAWLH